MRPISILFIPNQINDNRLPLNMFSSEEQCFQKTLTHTYDVSDGLHLV